MKLKFIALWLCLICIFVFILQIIFGTDLFILDRALVSQEPWRYLTSIFAHGSSAHLISNLLGLALFGLILEGKIGPRKVLFLFLTSGIIINLLTTYPRSLGASGAIYALIGALMVLRPFFIIWMNFMPVPMIIAGIIYLIQDVMGLFIPSGIGHYAHIYGLFIGIFFGFIWKKKKKIKKEFYGP